MKYTKKSQTKKPKITHKVCVKCGRKRLIKFFSNEKAHICNDCKRRSKRIKKQSSKGYLIKKLDDKWSLEVKERAGHKCEYCGKTTTLNSHHIFSRSNRAVRHDLDNGVCLCVCHHTFCSNFSAHKTPTEFVEWIKEKRGKEWYQRLRTKAVKIKFDN